MKTTPRVIGAYRLLPALLTASLLLWAAPGASAADNTLNQLLDAAKQALHGNRQEREPREPPRSKRPEYGERHYYDRGDEHWDHDGERYGSRDHDQRDYGRDRYGSREPDRGDYDRDGHDRYPQRAEGDSEPVRSRRATSGPNEAGTLAVIRLARGWPEQSFALTGGLLQPVRDW